MSLLLDVHARHGSSSSRLRLGGERAGELDALLQPVGQSARGRLADRWISEKSMIRSTKARCRAPGAVAGPSRALEQEAPRIFSSRPVMMLSSTAHALNRATF